MSEGLLQLHPICAVALARITYESLEAGLVGGKEFRTEFPEIKHRDHGEIPVFFSVHSVVQWFDNAID